MASDLDLNQPWFPDEELEDDQNHDFSSGDELDDDELDMLFNGTSRSLNTEQHTAYPFDLNMEPPEIEQQETEQQGTETELQHTQAASSNAETRLHLQNSQAVTHPEPRQGGRRPHKRARLSSADRLHILVWILNRGLGKDGKVKKGSIKAAKEVFGLSIRCLSNLWNTSKKQKEDV
ncbi:hypothetical protein SOVF_046900 [Spinacia oleracea]|nr:hypothetical protein SOVF_046900 [Spinacia oleracea]